MKKLIVLVLLAAGLTSSLLEAKQDFPCHKKNLCCNPKPLPEADEVGVIFITESGAYKFTQDITADISIQAHDVCLDLNCFTLTGKGNHFFAIEGFDLNNIIIKNGTIKNNLRGGIGLNGCNQLLLEDLKLNPVDKAINVRNSANNITSNGCLKNINVSDNSTSSDELILIVNGHTFSLTHINASDCIATNPGFTKLVNIDGVDNVTMSCCKINNNEYTATALYVPLYIGNGDTISVEDTEVNDNKVTNTNLTSGMVAAFFENGSNYSIKRCQFNRSTVENSSTCFGTLALLISNLVIDCCEANGSTLKIAVPGANTPIGPLGAGATGIFVVGSNFTGGSVQGFKILNSTANDTTHLVNLPGQTEFSGPEGIFLLGATRGLVEKCQANRTNVAGGTAGDVAAAIGVAVTASTDILICSCEALDTSVALLLNGSAIGFITIAPSTDISHVNCIGSGGNAAFTTLGFAAAAVDQSPNTNVTYKSCCAKNNHALNGFGFALISNTTDCSVSNSQAQDNTTAGIQVGIDPATHTNPQIIRNCAQENGAGIVLDATTSTITNLLLFENKAINNYHCGFEVRGTPTTPTFIGNKAQGNHPDFCPPTAFDIKQKKEGKLTCKDKSRECDSGDLDNISVCPKRTPQPLG